MPHESHNAMGQVVLDYPKAIQESVFEQLRVVRDGHLRIVFNPDLKVYGIKFSAYMVSYDLIRYGFCFPTDLIVGVLC